jgi:hypothetical protein
MAPYACSTLALLVVLMQEALITHGWAIRASVLSAAMPCAFSMENLITMSNWTPVRNALPEEGTPVQFSFNERTLVLRGVFRHGAFASRWSRYLPVEISSWCALDPDECMAEIEPLHHATTDADDREDDILPLPAAFAPSWSQQPARPTAR